MSASDSWVLICGSTYKNDIYRVMNSSNKKQTAIIREQDDHPSIRKSNGEIGFSVKTGRLTLLARKFLNVLIWFAQQNRGLEDEDGRWTIPISTLLKKAQYGSRDYELIRRALDDLQKVRVIRNENGGGVTSEVLIPSYTLANVAHARNEQLPVGEKKSGGALHLRFMLPPELKKQLLNPDQYTGLTIAIMASFKTVSGLALYEVCRRYSTNPGGVTYRDTWQNWWRVLTGATPDLEPPDFKYANRDVFYVALEEVNRLTDMEVTPILSKSGKSVRDLQFKVRRKSANRVDLGPPLINAGVLPRLIELGISKSEAKRIIVEYPSVEILATLNLLQERLENTSLDPIRSPAAYFKKALRDKFAVPTAIADTAKPAPALTKLGLEVDPPNRGAGPAIAKFEALAPQDQAQLLDKFRETLKGTILTTYTNRGLSSVIVCRSLEKWLGNHWPTQIET